MPLLNYRHFKGDDRNGLWFFQRAADSEAKTPTTTHRWSEFQAGQTVLALLSANMTPGAEVDSAERYPPPRCHPGTRQWLTTSIKEWVQDDHRQSNFTWLWGHAGVGKSAVAQTVAERAAADGQLGAAYFFSRLQGRDQCIKLWVTIAYQLAVRIPSYRSNVARQLANDSDIWDKAPSVQFKRLIAEPLASLPPSSNFLVILDGLDECQSEEAQLNTIELIASITKSSSSSPLVWMVFSRPERHIQALFSDSDFPIGCWRLELPFDIEETDNDVGSFVHSSFGNIREKYSGAVNRLWPSEDDINAVVNASSGLFASACTIMRYVDNAETNDPQGRLSYLINSLTEPSSIGSYHERNPLVQLDKLYVRIISEIPEDVQPIRLLHLLGTCILYPSLSILQIANLFSLDRSTFHYYMRPLLSVVNVPRPDRVSQDGLRFYHVSFADFLIHKRNLIFDKLKGNSMTITRTISFDRRLIGLEFIKFCFRVLAQTTPQHAMNLTWSPRKADGISAFSVSHQMLNYCAANVWNACLRLGNIDDPALYQTIINFRYPFLRFVKDKIPKSEFLAWIEFVQSQVQNYNIPNIVQPIDMGSNGIVRLSGTAYDISVRCFLLGNESRRVLVLISPELLIFEYPVTTLVAPLLLERHTSPPWEKEASTAGVKKGSTPLPPEHHASSLWKEGTQTAWGKPPVAKWFSRMANPTHVDLPLTKPMVPGSSRGHQPERRPAPVPLKSAPRSLQSNIPAAGRGARRGGSRGGISPGIYSPSLRPIRIDARLRDGSQKQVMAGLQSVHVNENGLPLRPEFGSNGREVALRTNFFAMTIPKGPFYEYEVVTTPTVTIKRVRRRILELAEDTKTWKKLLAGSVAHDHSTKLVASKLLPQPLSFDVPFYDEDENPPAKGSVLRKTFTLTVKFVRVLETESLQNFIAGDPQYCAEDVRPIISAFNLILAAWPTRSGAGGVMVGRNKFFRPSTSVSLPLGGGLEAVRGFYSSVRTAHKALMVNVNVCTTAFYKPGNLAPALIEILKMNSGPTTFVKGLRVKTTHLGYRKVIKEATEYTANTYVFKTEEFGEISVEGYFWKKYKIKLQHPNLPLLDVGGHKVNYLPAEICEILPNQPYRGKLLDEHTAVMIRYTTRPPDANAHAIETQGLQELGFTQRVPTLNAFGVSISQTMATVPGRVVPPPKIEYKGGRELDGRSFRRDKASWNLTKVKFVRGATLTNWAVLLISDGGCRTEFNGPSDPELRRALKAFAEIATKHGLNITSVPSIAEAPLPPYDRTDPGRGKAISNIRAMLPSIFKQKPQLIFIILPNTDKHIYSGLKRLFDMTLDLPNVCAQAERLINGGPQYYSNVSLKFNIKLGGINHVLDKTSVTWLAEMPTMVVGIDVTHPGLTAVKGTPSIAAVVASIDRDCIQFPASLRRQEPQKEMVTDLKDMMVERLKAFQLKSTKYPERILVYRNGVFEGQFASVIERELPAIEAACKALNMKTRPKLTIVVCAKRHHTRFFPTSVGDVDDKFNPLPGTVVDQGVTAVYNFDFYLQAHGSLQGSSRPTHYFVIHDEIEFTPDKLQALTNGISYMFARATKAVSLVAPAYYASLACERGRCYLHEMLHGIQNGPVDEKKAWIDAANYWGNGPTGKTMRSIMFYL